MKVAREGFATFFASSIRDHCRVRGRSGGTGGSRGEGNVVVRRVCEVIWFVFGSRGVLVLLVFLWVWSMVVLVD